MKIEMGKKYKTRNGQNVRIYAVDGGEMYPIHGAVEMENGYLIRSWTSEGREYVYEYEDCGDLVEVKEDWEILVEHFKNKGEPIFLVVDGEVYLCTDMEQCEYIREHCKSLLMVHDDGYIIILKRKKQNSQHSKIARNIFWRGKNEN